MQQNNASTTRAGSVRAADCTHICRLPWALCNVSQYRCCSNHLVGDGNQLPTAPAIQFQLRRRQSRRLVRYHLLCFSGPHVHLIVVLVEACDALWWRASLVQVLQDRPRNRSSDGERQSCFNDHGYDTLSVHVTRRVNSCKSQHCRREVHLTKREKCRIKR